MTTSVEMSGLLLTRDSLYLGIPILKSPTLTKIYYHELVKDIHQRWTPRKSGQLS